MTSDKILIPPWRLKEDMKADEHEATKGGIIGNKVGGCIPSPENYVYNKNNVVPKVLEAENVAFRSDTPQYNLLHNTCQDKPSMKYEGKNPRGQRLSGVFPLDTVFKEKDTKITASFYLKVPECITNDKKLYMPRIRFTTLRVSKESTDKSNAET